MRSRRTPRGTLAAAVLILLGASALGRAAAPLSGQLPGEGETSRDLAGIADEQEHLLRQLQRLRRTMEAMIPRLEQEGRSRALELLQQALVQLDAREAAAGSRTLEELLDHAHTGLDAGQIVQSLESQERAIVELERVLSILLDRESLEELEQSLADLDAVRADLEGLASRESELERATRALAEQSKSPAQREREQTVAELSAAQRGLLSENESAARASGALEREGLEEALERLIQDQATDAAVLGSWDPTRRERLAALEKPLDRARRAAAQAERLRAAAEVLRAAGRTAAAAATPEELATATGELDAAAEREERHRRAVGDASAEEAAAALRQAASALRQAGLNEGARAKALAAAEEQAQALTEHAQAIDEDARAARTAAREALAEAGDQSGPRERELAEALDDALAESDPADAAAATETAHTALEQTLAEERTLGPALAGSQDEAAETAERIARGLTGSEQAGPGSQRAAEELARAAEGMRSASRAARDEAPSEAQRAAEVAHAALERAREALQGENPPTAGSATALAGRQSELAEAARQAAGAQSPKETGGETGEAGEPGDPGSQGQLERAAEAMQRAAEELGRGRSASAARAQREALEALESAGESAAESVRPTTPEQQAEAAAQAAEQRAIERELLDLARRQEERQGAPKPQSLQRAAGSASEAAGSLDGGELDQAEAEEQEVQREIAEALEQVAEEEEQYQRLRQEELLFRIAEEAERLISGHREAMRQTREIDAARTADERPSRAERLRLRRVSGDELLLANRAGELADAIEAEQSMVFAELLRDAEQDLERVARDLDETGGYQTGERVQALQEDVEEALGWLVEALQRERERQQAEAQAGQGQKPPEAGQNVDRLVPDTSELKLLRRMEVDIVERLAELRALYPELDDPELEIDPYVLEDILRLAERHENTTRLFGQFRQRLNIPPPESADGAESAGPPP